MLHLLWYKGTRSIFPSPGQNGMLVRVPKGFRAPGLKNKGLKDRETGAPGLHGSTLGLRLARIIIFARAPGRKRLYALCSMAKISGLQGSKDSPPPPP